MNRLLPHPAQSLLLLLIWLILMSSFAPGHWLLGGLLAVVIPLACNRLLIEHPHGWKPLKLLRFLGLVIFDILIANFQVARLTLGRIDKLRPAFVEVPIDLDNELAVSVLVSVVSLTPGSLAADLSVDRRTLLVHGLDVPDAQAMIDEIKQRYEAPLKEIFPCSDT
ncbi:MULTISPECIES: Na+/H+ antiporter subunit E [unclassified Pseudomonas]|uniref:Na+/H+ antiporter subunit E n=1 Tax=unclassified Pseudomonas TaxID=196821 RepID=UPI002447E951|nr:MULTISPECIES: Na+/H+ antiporter subunit E [unclassified Pseudomonas]MDG9928953.1 Na+/H+ antiporter subunit E [Pseudomonas sp. GD04042]MDH0483878.1 Na+/H+ antiporter subunit E [Pseudomonas sp. GD04015]MDH0604279.1 Na+/H+ antiporter subunit E [Pseudomonas sp. GD03869]